MYVRAFQESLRGVFCIKKRNLKYVPARIWERTAHDLENLYATTYHVVYSGYGRVSYICTDVYQYIPAI